MNVSAMRKFIPTVCAPATLQRLCGCPQAAPTQPGHRARSPWDCREPYESAWHLARRPSTLHRSPAHLRTAHRASSLDYSRHSLASMMRPACRAASSGRNADNPCASVCALTNSETLSDPRSSLGAVVLGSVRNRTGKWNPPPHYRHRSVRPMFYRKEMRVTNRRVTVIAIIALGVDGKNESRLMSQLVRRGRAHTFA